MPDAEPGFPGNVSPHIKRLVALCPVSEIVVIMAVSDSVMLLAEGRILSLRCPVCLAQHEMQTRDPERRRRAS